MSVLMEFSMFPTSKQTSSSSLYVSRIIKMIRDSGVSYKLTPMGTIVETNSIEHALDILSKSYSLLEPDCERVYSVVKFDIRKGRENALEQKIKSVEDKIGKVNT